MTHCSDASLAAFESLDGTAATATHWIAIEYQRPWRPKVVLDNELSEPVRAWLASMKGRSDVRPVFIKQRGRRKAEGVRVYYANVETGHVHRFDLGSHEALPALPWEALMQGQVALGRTDEAPILVCTHSSRDHCCGLHGPAVCRALGEVADDRIWQCTHLGGHRFAATLIALPQGVHYGRVRASEAPALLEALDQGRIHDLDRYRGRAPLPVAVQAAEAWLRREHDLRHLGDVALQGWSTAADVWTVIADAAGRRHRLDVQQVEEHATREPSCGQDPTPVKTWVVTPSDS